jgi:hypothetical protein
VELQLNVKDVNGDGQPDNLEDTDIHLDLFGQALPTSAPRWPMVVPRPWSGGRDRGSPIWSLPRQERPAGFHLTVNDPADLKDLVFVPKEHFSGKVPLAVTVDILDTATTGTDRGSWSGNVSLRCCRSTIRPTLTIQNVTGQEDGSVSLGAGASLIDNDGSEQIVGLQIKGVPDGFTLSAPAVNNGGGVWQVPVGTDFSKLTLIPPADFSGTVDLTLSAFTLTRG